MTCIKYLKVVDILHLDNGVYVNPPGDLLELSPFSYLCYIKFYFERDLRKYSSLQKCNRN